jgi:hypothetical protein
MVRHSRKNKRGGGSIEEIQTQLDDIQRQVNELRNGKVEEEEPKQEMFEEAPSLKEATIVEEVVSKPWVEDKTVKFNDGNSGRVTLAFGRIMTLLDNNIKKGNDKKDWATIKEKMMNAKSMNAVQDVINDYKVSFSANYVAGTKRRSRKGRRKTRKY